MNNEDVAKIMRDKELATCHEAFDTYGMEKNCGFLMEECGELLSAVNKLRRGRVRKDAVFEELADVQLVITAFATHLGYRRFLEVKDAKLQKLARTIGEIKELEDAKEPARGQVPDIITI